MDKTKKIKFPAGFLWGAATSAYQVEGGIVNDWSEWEGSQLRINNYELRTGKKFDYDELISGRACNSFELFAEDLKCIKELGVNTYRFSLEWARLEPVEGEFSLEAVKYYLGIIRKLKESGIEPFVTLNHYTLPTWISKNGGWENKITIKAYLKFVQQIIELMGGEVKYFVTFNEPQIYVGYGYVTGDFPPNVKNLWRANKAFKNLMLAHKQAYELIHEKLGENVKVGIAHYLICHTPFKDSFLNKLVIKILDYIRNDRFIRAAEPCQDFIGFQYYHHDRIKLGFGGKLIIAKIANENKELTDMGWEIYPEGIYGLLKKINKYNKPIYITENGLSDASDEQRPKFIKDHLAYVHKAIAEGVDVRAYFYWSLLDNFEWAHGYGPKFGLYTINRQTFERTARPSARYYAEICKNNGFIID